MDIVDSGLVENDDAWVYLHQPVTGFNAKILRGFVYAQSQGVFTWRGSLALQQGQFLYLATLVGSWEYAVWGVNIPNVSITP